MPQPSQVILDLQPVVSPERLAAAQSAFETLIQKIRENNPENSIAGLIKELHPRFRHRIEQFERDSNR